MPKSYPRTDETYDVLKHHVGPTAKEYPCRDSYISNVKNGDCNDPYAQFRQMFRAANDAGAPVEIWLRDLSGIVERKKGKSIDAEDLVQRLTEKIKWDSNSTSEILTAIGDRQLDKKECHDILAALEVSRDIDAGIERIVSARLADFDKGLKIA